MAKLPSCTLSRGQRSGSFSRLSRPTHSQELAGESSDPGLADALQKNVDQAISQYAGHRKHPSAKRSLLASSDSNPEPSSPEGSLCAHQLHSSRAYDTYEKVSPKRVKPFSVKLSIEGRRDTKDEAFLPCRRKGLRSHLQAAPQPILRAQGPQLLSDIARADLYSYSCFGAWYGAPWCFR